MRLHVHRHATLWMKFWIILENDWPNIGGSVAAGCGWGHVATHESLYSQARGQNSSPTVKFLTRKIPEIAVLAPGLVAERPCSLSRT